MDDKNLKTNDDQKKLLFI